MTWYPQIDLKNAHMRMHSEPAASSWATGADTPTGTRWAYMYTSRPAAAAMASASTARCEKLADCDPDPVTGKNRMISTTWRMEAVPAFLATADGKVVATATQRRARVASVHAPTSQSTDGALRLSGC